MYPTNDKTVDTAYGAKGDWWGCGWHDGADFAVGIGTEVRAMWAGTVVEAAYPTTFGSAFGRAVVIDHDKLPDGSAGGWAIYCHLDSESVSPGQRVAAGQAIGRSGKTGNVSGPHLHVGVYMQPSWCSGCGVDPQKWFDAGSGSGGTSGYPAPTGKTVYLSKLHMGQEDSDSVWHLQKVLNGHSLPAPGNIELPLTGNYFDQTSTVVVTCQQQHGFGNDPLNASSVGPKQAEHLFAGSGLTVVDDR